MLMHSIREICAPGALVIAGWAGTKGVNPDRRGLKPVLGWLVHHAMQESSTRLRLGVNRESGEAWMKFFGPRWYRQPIWWDMVPPEAYCYPTMLQVCLSLAELDQGLPITGMIPAIKQGKRLRLELTVDTIDSFQITWDAVHALDRAQSESCYPEEGQGDDRRSDGDATQPA